MTESIKTVMDSLIMTKTWTGKSLQQSGDLIVMIPMQQFMIMPQKFGTTVSIKIVTVELILIKMAMESFSDQYGGNDCNDTNALINPNASDANLDGIDNDRDGLIDEDALSGDQDGDGFDVQDGDCDDNDATVYPGAVDTWYDGVDSDCQGDDDFDADGDGQAPTQYGGQDCDDGDNSTYFGATEIWYDGIDQDCGFDSDYDQDGEDKTPWLMVDPIAMILITPSMEMLQRFTTMESTKTAMGSLTTMRMKMSWFRPVRWN